MTTLQTQISGIPCQVEVTHFYRQKPYAGSAWHCDSPEDFSGFVECEFSVLDRRGRPAAWLEKKVTDADRQRIAGEVSTAMENDE